MKLFVILFATLGVFPKAIILKNNKSYKSFFTITIVKNALISFVIMPKLIYKDTRNTNRVRISLGISLTLGEVNSNAFWKKAFTIALL